jgi:hypothetical protein
MIYHSAWPCGYANNNLKCCRCIKISTKHQPARQPAVESKFVSATDDLGFSISLQASSPSVYHVLLQNVLTDSSETVPDE